MRRLVPLLLAASTLAVIPVQSADAAPSNKCDGRTANVVGTGKAEKFTLTPTKRIINAHGGNDVIVTDMSDLPPGSERPDGTGFLDFPVTVCMGSGNDILRAEDGAEGAPIRYLDGGKGFDTVEIYVCFEGDAGPKWTIRDVERITIINCLD